MRSLLRVFAHGKFSRAYLSLLLGLLLVNTGAKAQVIVETFEESAWTNSIGTPATAANATQVVTMTTNTNGATANSTFNSLAQIAVNVASSTSTNQTISTYTANGAASTKTTTLAAQQSSGNWIWWLWGNGAVISQNPNWNGGGGVATPHSAKTCIYFPNQTGYIATPILSTGISSITFYAYNGNGFEIGLKTNFTSTAKSGTTSFPYSAMPTTNSGTTSTNPGAVANMFSNNTSSVKGTNGSIQGFTYNVPAALASLPIQLAVWPTGGNGNSIDDIVITSPVVTPTITEANNSNGQVATANINADGSTNNQIANFQVGVTTANATLNSVVFTTTGTATSSDITNFQLWYNSSNSFPSGATSIKTISGAGAGTQTFSSLTQSILSGATGYFWITAQIPTSATYNHTIIVSATPALTFALGSATGTTSAAGTQTIITAPTVTTGSASSIATTSALVSGTVSYNGASTTVAFNSGTSTSYGTSTTATQSPVTSQSASVSATISSLTANTLYDFDVSGTNSVGTTNGSNVTFTTLSLAPTIGTGSAITSSGFTANWSAPGTQGSAAYTYTLQYSTDQTFATGVTTVPGISGTTSYSITGLTSGTTYYYEVEAVNAGGNSAWSSVSAGVTTSAATAPILSSNTVTSITATTATIGAATTSNGGATITSYGTQYNTTTPISGANQSQVGSTNFIGAFTNNISSLSPQTTYYYDGYATNSVGTGTSTASSFMTLSSPVTSQASSFTGTAGTAQVQLNWSVATFPGTGATATGYIILVRQDGTNPSSTGIVNGTAPGTLTLPGGTTLVTTVTSGSTITFTNTGLSNGTAYNYSLIPFTWDGANAATYNYDITSFLSTSATTNNSPSVTTGSATGLSTTVANLSGTVSANGLSSAAIFNYGLTNSYGSNITAVGSPVTTQSAAITGSLSSLTPNTIYHYDASATNSIGTTNGNDATFTTISGAPTVGSGSNATSSGFTANWTAPGSQGSASITYTVQYSTDQTFATGVNSVTNVAGTSTSISGLSASTTYYFRVEAVNAGGNSAWSSVSTAIITGATDTDPGSAPSVGNNINSAVNQYLIQSVQRSKYLYDNSSTPNNFLLYDNGTPTVGPNTKYAWYFVPTTISGVTEYALQNVTTGTSWAYRTGYYLGYNADGCATENANSVDLDNATNFASDGSTIKYWDVAFVTGSSLTSSGAVVTFTNDAIKSGGTLNYGYFLNTAYSPSTNIAQGGAATPVGPQYQVPVSPANCSSTRNFGLTAYIATPDLQVTGVTTSLSSNAQNGVPFTATATIINNGVLAIASGTRIKIKYVFEGTIDSLIYTGGLAAGASTTLSAVTVTPNQLSSGTPLTVTVNSNYAVAEYNYSNNSFATSNITVVAPTYAPIVVTNAATSITTTSATINGSVNANGYASTAYFNYGTSNSPYTNTAVSATPGTITGSSNIADSLLLSGLTPNTLYNFQDSATNTNGGSGGVNQTFTTLPNPPVVGTPSSATSSGFTANWLAPTGMGSTSYTYTVQASTSSLFTSIAATGSAIASGTLSYTFTTLSSLTNYYYRVEAVNAGGNSAWSATSASIQTSFSTGVACSTGSGASGSPAIISDGTPASATDAIWANAPTNTIANVINGKGYSGSTWQAMFDATNLYVRVIVQDHTLAAGNASCGAGGTSYEYDGTDIYLDGANTKAGNMTNSSQNTYNRTCSGTNTAPTTGTNQVNSTYSSTTGTTSWTEFTTIPWTNVAAMQNLSGSTISALSTIGFDVDFNDDSVAGNRNYGEAWFATNGGNNYNTPSTWGNAKLSVCTPPTISLPVATNVTATSVSLGATATALNGGGSLSSGQSGVEYSTSSGLSNPTLASYSGTPTINTAFSTPVTGLAPQTHYYYVGYSTRTNFSTNVTGVSSAGNFYTLSNPVTTQAAGFTAAAASSVQVNLNWTAATFPGSGATTTGYLLLSATGSNLPGLSNGNGAAPVLGANTTLVATLSSSAINYNNTGLSASTTYNYLLVPFTWDGTNAGTYNYLTASAPTASATTVTCNIWQGTVSNDWSNPDNWTCNTVPASNSDVTISSGSPVLSTDVIVNNLTVGSGSVVSINGHTLTLNGAISGGGTLSGSSTSNLTIGGSAGTISFTGGSQSLENLTLNNGSGASLGTPLYITGGSGGILTVGSGATLTTNNNLTIGSDAGGTAQVGNSAGTISGNVTVERYIPSNSERAWRLLSAPTVGQTINAAWQEGQTRETNNVPGYGTIITAGTANPNWASDGFDTVQVKSSILTYDQPTNNWDEVPSTFDALATTAGYFLYIRGDRSQDPAPVAGPTTATTLRSTGTLYQGTQAAISVPSGGFGLIGNIYASTIDFTQITTSGGIDDQYYVWDPKLLNQPPSLGAYVTLSSVNDWVPVPGVSGVGSYGNTATSLIESGQAFFVHASSAGTVTLTEGSKVSGSADVFRPASPASVSGKLTTNLYEVSGSAISLADGNVEVFNSAYSDSVDGNDALKLSNTEENFGILRDGKILVIEARQPVTTTDTIFYDMWNMKQQQYELQFIPTSLNTGILSAYLIDNYLGTSTPISLSDTSIVLFTVNGNAGSSASNRFKVVFSSSTPVPVTFTQISADRQGNSNTVTVGWKVAEQNGISSYAVERSTDDINFTVIGTVPAKAGSSSLSYSLIDGNAPDGISYYRVEGLGTGGSTEYTNVVEVPALGGNSTPGISVNPNPVTGSHMNISLLNQPAGVYSIRLLDISGQVVYGTTLSHGGGSSTQGIDISIRTGSRCV